VPRILLPLALGRQAENSEAMWLVRWLRNGSYRMRAANRGVDEPTHPPLTLTLSLSAAPARRRLAGCGCPQHVLSLFVSGEGGRAQHPRFRSEGGLPYLYQIPRGRVRPEPHLPAGGLQDEISGLGDTPAYRDNLRVEDVHESREAYPDPGPRLSEHLRSGLVALACEVEHVLAERCPLLGEPSQKRVRLFGGCLLGTTRYGRAGGESLEATTVATPTARSGGQHGDMPKLPPRPPGAPQ
jgi:hypothetical protein